MVLSTIIFQFLDVHSGVCGFLIQLHPQHVDSVVESVTAHAEKGAEYKNSSLKMRPIPAKGSDPKEIIRQIYACCDAALMSNYEAIEYPKHCFPCWLLKKQAQERRDWWSTALVGPVERCWKG